VFIGRNSSSQCFITILAAPIRLIHSTYWYEDSLSCSMKKDSGSQKGTARKSLSTRNLQIRREAELLRENLRRRKEQKRGREEVCRADSQNSNVDTES